MGAFAALVIVDRSPWNDEGHGLHALAALAVLEQARKQGLTLSFLVHPRAMRSYPQLRGAIEGEGHSWHESGPDDPGVLVIRSPAELDLITKRLAAGDKLRSLRDLFLSPGP